jgi:hypothetical protein
MAARSIRPVPGRKKVPKTALGKFAHSDGWNAALDNALKKIGWPPGDHANAKIEFFANVHVENPGIITDYVVRITPGG